MLSSVLLSVSSPGVHSRRVSSRASKKSTIANGGTETRAHRHTEGKGTPGTIGDWSLSLHTGEQEIGSAIQKRVAARGMA